MSRLKFGGQHTSPATKPRHNRCYNINIRGRRRTNTTLPIPGHQHTLASGIKPAATHSRPPPLACSVCGHVDLPTMRLFVLLTQTRLAWHPTPAGSEPGEWSLGLARPRLPPTPNRLCHRSLTIATLMTTRRGGQVIAQSLATPPYQSNTAMSDEILQSVMTSPAGTARVPTPPMRMPNSSGHGQQPRSAENPFTHAGIASTGFDSS